MKDFHVTLFVQAVGDTTINVPEGMSREDSIQYVKDHIGEIIMPTCFSFIPGTIALDEDNCDYEE